MGEADETEKSDDSDTTEGETTPGEGEDSTETPDDTDTPVIDPAEDEEETPAEEPVEEVVEPTTDPETPVTSEEPEDSNEVNGAEINAEETVTEYTVSIDGFEDVSAYITASATVGDARDKGFAKTGSLTAAKGAAVTVTLSAKSGAKITSVKNGEANVPVANGTATITLSSLAADVSITVEAAAAYKLTTELVSGVTAIKLDASLKDAVGAADDAGLSVTTADVAQGDDLKFTLAGSAAGDDARYNVFYQANGSDEKTPIDAAEETVGEGQSATKVDTYTVKKEDLADFHSIKIIVEKEAQVDLKDMLDTALIANTDVDVVYWGTRKSSVTTGDEKAWVEGAAAANYDAITKAYVGGDFKFKVVVKDTVKNKAVSKVTMTVDGEPEEITATDGGEYSFKVKENTTAFAIETDYTTAATNKLTYTLKDTCDKDSVTSAVITKITVGSTDKTDTAIVDYLGGKDPSATLKAGEAVSILKASGEEEITAIEVTVTPAADYTVVKGTSDKQITVAADGSAVYKFTKTAGDDSIAISADMAVAVETDVKATADANEKFFKVTRDKGADDSPLNTHISDPVVTAVPDKVVAVPTSDTDTTPKAYKVLAGVKTVEFTVTADAGYTLKDYEDYTGFKSIKEEAAGEGKVKYTVTLFASKITGAEDSPTEIAVDEDGIKLAAEVKPGVGEEGNDNFTVGSATYTEKGADKTPQDYTFGQETIPYGSKLTTTITAAAGCHLVSVSYNMGGTDTPVTLGVDGTAAVTVPEVTAKVTINVTAEKDYKKTELTKAADYDGADPTKDSEGVYSVRYDGKYLVGLTNGGTDVLVKDFKAVVKDEAGKEVALPRIVAGSKYKIDLTRAKTSVAGQTITIDMVVGDKVVDTYVLSVNKKTSKLTIEGVAKAEKEQRVDSIVKYAIDTDGEVSISDFTDEGDILYAYDVVGKNLVVTLNPMTTTQITKTAATSTTPAVYHSATITLTSDDDPDMEASIVVTAKPFIEDIANQEITLKAGDKADTVLNVLLGMDGVEVPENGELYYELTVTPKPATGTTLDSKLLSSVPAVTVAKKGSSQNKQIVVAKDKNLGMGAACGYEVKAKLTYDVDGGTTKESTKEITSAEFATIEGKDIKYVNNLKLTKDKSFKGTLYTGQDDEIVIANVNWKADKNVNYKILSDDDNAISDGVKYDNDGNLLTGLEVGQNALGQIVVTDVPEDTWLGKHTITVEATADQTTGHEMYKSRATITVNVVKGIGSIDITPASQQIYKKDARSKATLKMTAVLNDSVFSSWDGKKYVTAPKSKNLKWELVGADSMEGAEYPLPDSFAGKAVTINEKNGTVTVDRKFAVSPNKANNRFCVKATATDYVGNTTINYSDNIEITGKPLDIAKIALVKDYYDDEESESKYEVVAVQSTNNEEIKKSASELNGAVVYALPEGVELAKEYTSSQWNTVRGKLIALSDYSVTSSGKKVVEVCSNKSLNVLTAGKKVKLTVTANDGSKQKRVVPLNLEWTGAEKDFALGIQFNDSVNFDVFNPNTEYKTQKDKAAITVKPITATGAVRLSINLMEGDKSEGSSTTFDCADRFIDYKLAAKGGKLTYNQYGDASLVTTAKDTTLTLTIGKGRDAKKSVYTITNNAYVGKEKAPKVTVKGSLHENGHKSEQQVTMAVKDSAKKLAKVEIDWSSMNAKNRDELYHLDNTLVNKVIALDENGEMTLSFAEGTGDWIGFTPGSYKLKVTVGKGTAANFTAETLPANVTLKVVKNKAFTFKPQTTYTIGKIDGGAILTGKSNAAKGEKTFMNFYDLRNANVNGRPNDFTHYFTIEYDAINNTQRLVLNEEDPVFKEKFGITAQAQLNWETIDLTKIDKKDLTGYVSYDARANKKFYGIGTTGWENSVEGTVKITVKLAANPKNNGAWKASLKYTTNKAEVLAKDNEKAVINVMSGNEYVTVSDAIIYETDNLKADTINEKGQVLIAVKGVDTTKSKSYSTSMKVVPASSRFAGELEPLRGKKDKEAEYMAAIEKYGILVKVTVVTKLTAAEVTATPDPVTVFAAVNIIGAKDETTGWTTKLTAESLTNIKPAEKNAAMAALATEVSNYLKDLAPFKTGFTVTGSRVLNGVYSANGNPYVIVVLTVAKGSDLEDIWLRIAAKEGSVTPPPAEEKAPSDAVTLLGTHSGTWTDTNGNEIKVILSSDGSSVTTDNAATLAAAVQKWINEQDGYTGFTVAQKASTTVGVDGKVTLTISKSGETDAEIEITLTTENQS